MIFKREPALLIGVVNAVLALLTGFGLDVDPEQVGLINAAVAAVLSFVTRTQVWSELGVKDAVAAKNTSV